MKQFEQLGIGLPKRSYIICEIGQAHDGSEGIAHSMIDAASDSGVDAVKFQTHIASEESTYDDKFRVSFSYVDSNRFDYWKRMEFTEDQWARLAEHAREKGLEFISSPFSNRAIDILEKIGVNVWKIGSGELLNTSLIDYLSRTEKPVIASTGLHSWNMISIAVRNFEEKSIEYALLQCTSAYPNRLEDVGINVMLDIKNKFYCLSGLSDHSGKLSPSLYAMAQGADVIEVHATYDRKMFGPDSSSSLTFRELSELVTFRNEFSTLAKTAINKDLQASYMQDTRLLFSRSLAVKHDLPNGHTLTPDDVTFKKPGGGINTLDLPNYIGKKLAKDVTSKYLLKEDDFES